LGRLGRNVTARRHLEHQLEHQLFLAYSAWNTDMADTISSQSDWKANQKRAEKKAKTITQPPNS
jgi:hypothetical protein